MSEEAQLTEERVIDDLRFLSDRLSTQVRFVATGLLVVSWGLLISPTTVPLISRRGLLGVGALAIIILAIDVVQYMIGYKNARRYLVQLEKGKKIPGYNRRDFVYRFREWAFWAKAWLAVFTTVLFLAVIAPALLASPMSQPPESGGRSLQPMNWWNVAGLIFDFFGVLALGLDASIWTRAAAFDLWPGTPAPTRLGFDVPRPIFRHRMLFYWLLIITGFAIQVVGQFR